LKIAQRALNTFSTPEMGKYIESSGLGNHPEFIRLMFRIGNMVAEDGRFVQGKGNSAEVSREKQLESMYPKMAEQTRQ
jgi:hypothetical protein